MKEIEINRMGGDPCLTMEGQGLLLHGTASIDTSE